MPLQRQAEVRVETLIDTLGNVEAYYCSILWHKCSARHEAKQ